MKNKFLIVQYIDEQPTNVLLEITTFRVVAESILTAISNPEELHPSEEQFKYDYAEIHQKVKGTTVRLLKIIGEMKADPSDDIRDLNQPIEKEHSKYHYK